MEWHYHFSRVNNLEASEKLRMLTMCLDNQILIYSIYSTANIKQLFYRYKHPGLKHLKLISEKGRMVVIGNNPHLLIFSINAKKVPVHFTV